MIALLLFALACGGETRAALAHVELSGPCAGIELELPGAGRAQLELSEPLLSGERRTLTLAVPLPAEALPEGVWLGALQRALPPGVQARWLRLEPAPLLDGVSDELLARPRPALSARSPRLPWSALFVLGAAFAIALARRRQVLVAAAIALLACGSLFLLTRRLAPHAPASVRLLEASFDAPAEEAWLAVDAVLGGLRAVQLARSRIEVVPARASLRCRSRDAAADVSIEAPGASVLALSAFDPGPRRLTRAINAWGNFESAWLREADGRWLALGAWPVGESLPQGSAGDPPGWLVPPLPMGRSLFLGRLADGQGTAASPSAHAPGGEAAVWVRGLGL